ncbi:unnamed protein product [Symbiodinium natans]|uniref:Uncharacterized protein n=1 Tax=Symbiodinium natans TaxID=878477 RepID=A0A812MND0_9DINO|nr:unnamed protein product [Symbiodinium natans]
MQGRGGCGNGGRASKCSHAGWRKCKPSQWHRRTGGRYRHYGKWHCTPRCSLTASHVVETPSTACPAEEAVHDDPHEEDELLRGSDSGDDAAESSAIEAASDEDQGYWSDSTVESLYQRSSRKEPAQRPKLL